MSRIGRITLRSIYHKRWEIFVFASFVLDDPLNGWHIPRVCNPRECGSAKTDLFGLDKVRRC